MVVRILAVFKISKVRDKGEFVEPNVKFSMDGLLRYVLEVYLGKVPSLSNHILATQIGLNVTSSHARVRQQSSFRWNE